MNRKLFVATNWKCTIESPSDADQLVESMNAKWLDLPDSIRDSIELSVHPPYVFLDRVRQGLNPTIAVGSQNVYDAGFPNKGNTGATSPKMLAGLGIEWILLGHSDRRNNLGETDDLIAEKAALAIQEGLGVVLTIGETKEERDDGRELDVLRKQLLTVADAIPDDEATWKKVVLAYEPVWAVGEGATPCQADEAQRIHTVLRQSIREHVSEAAANACRITYTGSVNPQNAAGYAGLPDVDGFVVGRAGLDSEKLGAILQTLVDTKAAAAAAARS